MQNLVRCYKVESPMYIVQKSKNMNNKPDDSTSAEIKDVREYHSGKEKPIKFNTADDLIEYLDD
jgi:hypothetical protein